MYEDNYYVACFHVSLETMYTYMPFIMKMNNIGYKEILENQ